MSKETWTVSTGFQVTLECRAGKSDRHCQSIRCAETSKLVELSSISLISVIFSAPARCNLHSCRAVTLLMPTPQKHKVEQQQQHRDGWGAVAEDEREQEQ